MGMFVLAAGGVLGLRLKAEYRGESLGQAPKRKKIVASAVRPATADKNAGQRAAIHAPGRSGPIAAVLEKELRAMLRTLPVLYAVGAPLLMVLVFSTIFLKNNGSSGHVFPMALPVCLVYAQLGFTQLFYNNMGAEGAAIQLYFLSPTSIRTVMLAKNLFHSALFFLVAAVAATLTTLRLGIPDAAIACATAAWLLFSLPMNLMAGNIFSLRMPYRVNPGRLSRQRGSQANALLSLLVQLGVMSIGAGAFGLGWYLGRQWLTTAILLVFSAGAVAIWLRVLSSVDAIANQRRDTLLATVMKTE
jgi:ABC-2 type transport system permease protein